MLLSTGISDAVSSVLNALSLVLVFVIVLFLAYISSRFIAKCQKNMIGTRSNIRVVESFRLDANKLIAIIKICDDYYAIAIGKNEVTYINKLDAEAVKDLEQCDKTVNDVSNKLDFKDILSQIKKNNSDDKIKK